jgi:hypothetical protein
LRGWGGEGGGWGKGEGRGKGEEMTQTLYAHLNNRNLKKRKPEGEKLQRIIKNIWCIIFT